jgi:CubicO group peptidase (beta-lactamase class C family)
MPARLLIFILFLYSGHCFAQPLHSFADSIHKACHIPELSYAVISADSVFEIGTMGVTKINTQRKASLDDRFRIGSNTKAVTGLLAARLIHEGKLQWNTKFFDLFSELKAQSRKAYYDLTLLQLLSFRASLVPYTYTAAMPKKEWFQGNDSMQRYEFAQWFLKQPLPQIKDSIFYTNLGYVAAGMMLEKASGESYAELIEALNKEMNIHFAFGQPNNTDALQTWGHDAKLRPEPPADNYKLNWLLAAGNINTTLPDYIQFIQLQLKGLQGRASMLSKEEFYFLHYGLGTFSVGWFNDVDEQGEHFSYNTGNPGTFLSKVYVYGSTNRAYIIFANVQADRAEAGMDALYEKMKKVYGKPISRH